MLGWLRRLPRPVKDVLLRAAERLGTWPHRIRTGPAKGLRLLAPLSRHFQYGRARHEPHVTRMLQELVEPGMVVCDGGAHLGYLTLVMARRVGADGRVYSFEPAGRHAEVLRRTVARNGLSQVTVVEQALGASCARAWMREGPTDAMARVVDRRGSGEQARSVSVTTLDAWAAEQAGLARIHLIKLDVEGRELEALEGAVSILRRDQPIIVCELHWSQQVDYRPRQVVEWLEGVGYEVSLIRRPDQQGVTLEHMLGHVAALPAPPQMTVFHILALAETSPSSRPPVPA